MAKLKITADEFAERVSKATNGRISIVKESYTGTQHKVTAYCNVHKIYFNVNVARNLYRGNANCPECAKKQKQNEAKIIPFNKMLQRFKEAYGEKFSYDESSYRGKKKLMKVHCNDCGEDFEITPEHHLKYNNGGCPNCHKTKIVKCSICGKDIVVDRRSSTNIKYICNECCHKHKKKYKIKNKTNIIDVKYCKICGRKLNNNLKCDNEFCNTYHYNTLIVLVKKFGFDKNKIGTDEVENEFKRIRDMIYDMYWNQHMSSTEICKKYGYKSVQALVNSLFKKLKIPSKTLSLANSENIKMGRLVAKPVTKYISKYHITWQNKKVYLRSSYEIDYATLLDETKIEYEVENLRIVYYDSQKHKERIAIPDFYLPETNTIVEIKSNWTLDLINMIDKVKAYKENGYSFKLILEHKETDIYSLQK